MHYDVIVIGGSYAGMAASLQLVRARRSVLLIDAGERRNRFACPSFTLLGELKIFSERIFAAKSC